MTKKPQCFYPGCETFPWLVITRATIRIAFCEEHKAEAKLILVRHSSAADNA